MHTSKLLPILQNPIATILQQLYKVKSIHCVELQLSEMNRTQAIRMAARRTLQHYEPRAPKLVKKDITAIVEPGAVAVGSSIMNGAKAQPLFPPGTFFTAYWKRLPYFFETLAAIFVVFSWPAFDVYFSDVIHNIPPNDTAMVQTLPDGLLVCNEIVPVHLDIGEDDD